MLTAIFVMVAFVTLVHLFAFGLIIHLIARVIRTWRRLNADPAAYFAQATR